MNNPKKTWVGLSHYTDVITDPAFLQVVLPNTFLFMALSVGGALVIGLCLALVFNRGFRGQKLVQTMLLLPLMVAPVIAAIMMRWMFNDQFGIVNVVLEDFVRACDPVEVNIEGDFNVRGNIKTVVRAGYKKQ